MSEGLIKWCLCDVFVCVFFFFWFCWKAYIVSTHLIGINLSMQVFIWIEMGAHNMCLYKEVDKKYTGCNLKIMQLLYCVHIWVLCGK